MESISVITYRGFSNRQRRDDTRAGHGGHQERQICQTNHQNCLPRDTGQDGRSQQRKETTAFPNSHSKLSRKKVGIRHYPLQSGYHPRPRRTGRRSSGSHTEPDQQRPEYLRRLPVSPKRHGYKIFVFRQTEYACRLRAELLQGEIDYGCLEEVHSKLYNDAKQYYEALLERR